MRKGRRFSNDCRFVYIFSYFVIYNYIQFQYQQLFIYFSAQQYYIEYGNDMNEDRLFNLIPNYIPDYCLQRENANEMWAHLILQAYKKVRINYYDNGAVSKNSPVTVTSSS